VLDGEIASIGGEGSAGLQDGSALTSRHTLWKVYDRRLYLRKNHTLMLKISTRTFGDITILDAEGRVTASDGTSVQLRSALRDAADWSPKILVNLERVTYMDSSGIGEIVRATTARGRQVKMLRPSIHLEKLLKVSKLDKYLEIHFDERAALVSFQ